MVRHKNLLAFGIVLIAGVIVFVFCNSTKGYDYDIEPQITLPEYQNDLGRIISAYERMIDRLMYLNENNGNGLGTEIKAVNKKLASIEYKLTVVSTKLARIEKTLGLEPSQYPGEIKDEVKNDANENANIKPQAERTR